MLTVWRGRRRFGTGQQRRQLAETEQATCGLGQLTERLQALGEIAEHLEEVLEVVRQIGQLRGGQGVGQPGEPRGETLDRRAHLLGQLIGRAKGASELGHQRADRRLHVVEQGVDTTSDRVHLLHRAVEVLDGGEELVHTPLELLDRPGDPAQRVRGAEHREQVTESGGGWGAEVGHDPAP